MNLTANEQLEIIRQYKRQVEGLLDYLPADEDVYVRRVLNGLSQGLHVLEQSFYDENTYIKLVDRETGEIEYRYFEKGDVGAVCYKAAQFYAWSDCDDTYRIEEIMCDGHELCYVGWRPCMEFKFKDLTTGRIVYDAFFPEWDH